MSYLSAHVDPCVKTESPSNIFSMVKKSFKNVTFKILNFILVN